MFTVATLGLLGLLANAQAGDAPGDVMPDRHWDVQHLHLDVRIDPRAGTVEGTTTHTVVPLPRRHRWLRLHQRALNIQSVSIDGTEVQGWRLGEDSLDIPMPQTGAKHEVSVTYTASPKLGLHFRRPEGSADPVLEAWSQGEDEENRYWFPSWDYPSDRFTFSSRIEAPSELIALSNGVLQGKEPSTDGYTAWSYRLDQQLVNYLVMAAVGDYEVVTDDSAGVPFEYIAPRGTNLQATADLFDNAVSNLTWLENTLGAPYPFPVYRQIAVSRFLWGGMENSSASTIALRHIPQTKWDREPSWGRTVVSHELAHQWFGDLLTTYGWRELWLNEGFADYYEKRFLETEEGPYAAAVWAIENRSAALWGEHPMAPNGYTFDGSDNHGVYVRGASFLRFLELHLGRDVFDAGIRSYVAHNADRLVETSDLRRELEDVSGSHLGWAFDTFVHSPTLPAASSTWSWANGTLTVTLTPTVEDLVAHVPVRVEVGLAEGTRTQTLWLGEGPTRWALPTTSQPLYVAVDADAATLVSWTHEQTPDQWAAQLRGAESLPARVVAMQQLGTVKEATDSAVAALISVVDDRDLHPEYVNVAVSSLGKLGTAPTIDRLLAAIDDPRRTVREASIDALASVPPEPPVIAHLLAVYGSDEDPINRASALQVLGTHSSEEALKLARRRLKQPDTSTSRIEHSVALTILGSHGETRDVKTVVAFLDAEHQAGVRRAAMGALPTLARNLDNVDDWRAEAAGALFEHIDDPDYRVRHNVITALGSVGDAPTEARLRAWARTDPTPLADAARRSAGAIRKRLSREGNPITLPSDEEESDEITIDERLETLEERLQRLEKQY